MTRAPGLPTGARAGAAALGAAALLAAALAGCARQVPPVAALEPGEAPMVTGQSPGSPFTDGSKEAPFSSSNSYPQGAASPPARAR
ncbi:MAG: hypothetical protein ACRYG6_02850 [Janthinobacterium lividum]